MPEARRSLPSGDLLVGRYRLLERLGRGGMATVHRAVDDSGRDVAVKLLDLTGPESEIAAERFRREAIATAALSHPNIVAIFDSGVDSDRAFIVMELLPPATLADELRERGRFPIDEARTLAVQVARALSAAHTAGMIHRDIKPGNITRAATGEVKVLDFGIAQFMDDLMVAGHAPLTATGAILGTSTYLAPEQAQKGVVDHRADLYALGCVLFALPHGRAPYKGPTTMSTLMAHLTEPVPDLGAIRPEVPAEIVAVVTALLAKDPSHRPQTAADVAASLQAGDLGEVKHYLPAFGHEATAPLLVPSPSVEPTAALTVPVTRPDRAEVERRRRPLLIALIAAAILLPLAFGIFLMANREPMGTGQQANPTEAVPTPTPAASGEPSTAPATVSATPAAVTESTPAAEPATATPSESTSAPAPAPTTAQAGPADSTVAMSAADALGSAVKDATTGGDFDKDSRKEVDAALRDLAKALRSNDDQAASDALSAVDQALSDSGQKGRFTTLFDSLKDAVDAWTSTL